MQVKYVGPFDAVELAGVGIVKAGEPVDVPADLAGRPPVARVAAAHAELHEAITNLDHPGAAALREEIIGLDVGVGLLAQPDNWQPVSKSPKAAASQGDGPHVP